MTERSDLDQPLPTGGLPRAERMKFFTDAVVAIALTLLILPLLESVSDAATHHLSTAQVLREHGNQIFSFTLSFVVVASFWNLHHRVFEHVEYVTPPLNTLNFAWMFTIVFLQFSTALVGSQPTDRLLLLLYIGTMTLCSLCMSGMSLLTTRSREMQGSLLTSGSSSLAHSLASSVLFVAALLLALLVPRVNFYALLLLLFTSPLRHLLARWLERRAGEPGAADA